MADVDLGTLNVGDDPVKLADLIVDSSGTEILNVSLPLLKGDKGDPGTTDYENLENKPKINSITLIGDQTPDDLDVKSLTNIEIENLLN